MKVVKSKGFNVSAALLLLCLSFVTSSFLHVTLVFGEPNTIAGPLTETERAWLQAHPTIRLAPDPEFKPIEFFDEDGNYQGIGADYVKLITKKLGITLEIVRCENWEEVVSLAKRHEVDILNTVVKTPQREEYLLFPQPYLTIPSVIIAKKTVTKELTLDMLKGMNVVMVSGYGYVDLMRNKHPDIKFDLVSDVKAALRKVSFGIADAFVGDLATAIFYLELDKITNLKVAGEAEPPNISGFAVRSDWPELSHILEKGIALLTEEEREAIHKKWLHIEPAPGFSRKEVRNMVLGIMTILFLIAVAFLLWNRMMKQKVRQRTEDLHKEIGERKQVEQALRESEKRFLDLAEHSTDWIWELDENEIFTYSSPCIKDLLGYTPEEIIGQSVFATMPPPETEKFTKEFFRFKKERKTFSNLLNVNKHKNGNTVILESSGVPIIDNKGNFRGYRGIDRNITERINLEEQLRQAHKMEAIGTLAEGIAHDFNNILAAIIGYAELAKIDISECNDAKDHINEVLKASNRAKELVQQIRTFGRKGHENNRPIQPHLVIEEALKLIRVSLPATTQIQEDIDTGCGSIMANPTNIHQIVVNLCTNALHALENEQGVITVTLKKVTLTHSDVINEKGIPAGEFIELMVSDTGHGIPRQTIERIFEPYFTTKEVDKGSGMGLAVVHGIIQNCKGCIKVDSSPGKGTTFRVYFPTLAEDKEKSTD